MRMKIGFIGLGNMGAAIAENLLKGGHAVTAWNRSPAPVAALAAKGATAAASAEATLGGDVLFSMLASDAAMQAVGFPAMLDKAGKGLTHINLATISVAFARELAAAHDKHGLGYVSAPVFGRPDAAAAGKLLVVAAGKAAAIAKVTNLLDQIGRRTVIVGEAPEQANLFKIAGNFLIVSAMESMGEAFALLKKGGIDAGVFHEILTEGLFAGLVYPNYGKAMLAEKFEPAGFALKLGLKDVNLAREAAEGLGMTMPLADLVKTHYDAAVAQGWGEKDWSALGAVIAQKAGL
jgi:3-hydroxyisobutyrate dehydrogenase-like beta-hydroxyacid dehydrogenase